MRKGRTPMIFALFDLAISRGEVVAPAAILSPQSNPNGSGKSQWLRDVTAGQQVPFPQMAERRPTR
jgi:hypothetical protein